MNASIRLENIILYNLFNNESYARKAVPFLLPEYFKDRSEKILFVAVKDFISKYNALPSKEAILISLGNNKRLKETDYNNIVSYLTDLKDIESQSDDWLLDNTESWCKDMALQNAILTSIKIIDNPASKMDRGSITKLVSDALSVGFDNNIGHDFFNDADKQFEFYHLEEERLEFDLEYFNKITNGGVKKKTLFMILAGTAVGKSLCLVHMAASFLSNSKKVLYITLEMPESDIRKRIDSNLLDISMDDLKKISKDVYKNKIEKIRNKTTGELKVKEYPTGSANVDHFRHLLSELKLKQNFVPDVVIVDYLNLCSSSRVKNNTVNSYTFIKQITEELHGLSMEYNIPVISCTQTNRSGQNNTDLDFEDVAESHGLSQTADYIIGMINTEELEKLNQIMFKQIKNRHGDTGKYKRFVVGIDRNHMRLYDVEQSAQNNISDSGKEDTGPVFDNTGFGSSMKKRKDYSKINFNDDDLF